MLLPGENNPRTWLFLTILVSTIIACCESSGSKTLNINLGFDLLQGSNGAPSLRIRDIEDSTEFNPRAVDDASGSDSNSSDKKSDESPRPKKEESSKETKAKSSGSGGDDDDKTSVSREERPRSTRGLKAGDFEPEEENPKIHGNFKKNDEDDDDNDSNESNRRRKRRHIGNSH